MLLTMSSNIYSSAFIVSRLTSLRKGSWFNGERCFNLLLSYNLKLTRFVSKETQLEIVTPVRLNLFNHVLALFRVKFDCNLAIRYSVFRWELYKVRVRECEEISRSVQFKGVSRLDLVTGKSSEWHTCETCRGSWKVTTTKALQDKTSSLARQLACDSNSQLVLVARSSCQNALFVENWPFAFLIHPTINTFIPTKCRELLERILREKP